MKSYIILLLIFICGCHSINPEGNGTEVPDHSNFDKFLKKHVDMEGMVDYKMALKDSSLLTNYINDLCKNPPSEIWSKNDKLAYWINLYNAATIQLILRNYPIKSIKDIGSSIQIPFINTPWQIEFITIGESAYDLDNIEHNILRKNFAEPRIHFALVCAAMSCPKLRNEPYTGINLNEQLEDQAVNFLNNPSKNNIVEGKAELSKIFFWFKQDFTIEGDLKLFVNNYLHNPIPIDVSIEYGDYDWSLNEQPN